MFTPPFFFNFSILLFLSFFTNYSFTQNTGNFDIGLEIQAYPTGLISGAHLEWGLSSQDGVLTRIGYNLVRHRDLGIHNDERGGGFGFTLGYRHYFKENRSGFLLGAKCDLWFNKIDWKDNIGQTNEVGSQTKVKVLQPTIEVGYMLNSKEKGLIFAPTIALGAEINIQTDGAEVGQGAIILLGFTLGKRF